ncbi:MAG: histidinol-phosphate transaminase [Acidimicrobiales bacterium]
MSALLPRRGDLADLQGYHSPQMQIEVRLNTNESPFPPPAGWQERLADVVAGMDVRRYPDRGVTDLRRKLAELHGVDPSQVFCANGSNEALQSLLLAFGGPGRTALVFEPTYSLHSHIARLTLTEVVGAGRGPDLRIDPEEAAAVVGKFRPAVTFVCSPNNPTGRAERPEVVADLVARAPGLVVVDEAYGQFAPWSALDLFQRGRGGGPAPGATDGLVVVRTFSKTWAMAGLRLGYLVAGADVVAGCEAATLPYHLSTVTQEAGLLALDYRNEMMARVAHIAEERGRLEAALAGMPVDFWPSDANFILFRPRDRGSEEVWKGLVDRGVLIRDCSRWSGLTGCLRVTVGTPEENVRFLRSVRECL